MSAHVQATARDLALIKHCQATARDLTLQHEALWKGHVITDYAAMTVIQLMDCLDAFHKHTTILPVYRPVCQQKRAHRVPASPLHQLRPCCTTQRQGLNSWLLDKGEQ